MTKLRAYELRTKSKAELEDQLKSLKTELASLRVTKVTGSAANKLGRISAVRKGVAAVLTVMNQTQREHLRKHFAGKKYLPTDLRVKKTRAIRRQLNQHERSQVTIREAKKRTHFPLRKYALKA
ncbi:ribosomal protein L35e [Capsaspora owczarzaki ATCC 30864]|uniref:Ribosomal protein L35e n=1 Tax=Capsaspora owczarzaki (strain ATCC 30864) TaxID=595528 RepID=A0A0D2WK76_CAPO3|nr:ribosomal protein L35e [Capsaspora owczarzaki ATCC 30864]KJE90590.1 ribosomal protein L35e [Capsaspora owczarzaki ATCC 30864]|eukprot:XP_004364753.1 ribosomal protein L35e [Capsaspora owczarzaki ATCC 30864]